MQTKPLCMYILLYIHNTTLLTFSHGRGCSLTSTVFSVAHISKGIVEITAFFTGPTAFGSALTCARSWSSTVFHVASCSESKVNILTFRADPVSFGQAIWPSSAFPRCKIVSYQSFGPWRTLKAISIAIDTRTWTIRNTWFSSMKT